MEEENQFFGDNVENVEKNENLESEDFKFYHQNKEEAKKNIDNSSQELTDFVRSLIQDIPGPTQEQVAAGVEKTLKASYPENEPAATVKTNKTKKVTLKVLFIAALLSIVSVTCLFAVGNSHNVSVENGFAAFAKDTVKIVFFGEAEQEYVPIDVLLADLKQHGYGDVLLPQEFTDVAGDYNATVPEYLKDSLREQVLFEISDAENKYVFNMSKVDFSNYSFSYESLHNAVTVASGNISIYVFEYENGSAIEFNCDGIYYYISSKIPLSDMVKIAESIK